MPSSTPANLPHHQVQPIEIANKRPEATLGNLLFEIPTSATLPANPQPTASSTSTEKIPTFIVWSIFNLLFLPFGLLCCYFSYQVRQFKGQYRYALATKWSKRAFIVNIITTLLMVGVIITTVMLRYDFEQRFPDLQFNQTRTTGAFIAWQPGR